jgi:Domain of unknown function (DUF1893).
MNNLERAKSILKSNEDYTFVVCKDEEMYTSSYHGVRPLIELIDTKTDIKGFSVADKVVGKGAALLFVLAGVKEVHSVIMSELAVEVLKEHGVTFYYDTLVGYIINRTGTDMCPIEKAVKEVKNLEDAYPVIKETIKILMAGK